MAPMTASSIRPGALTKDQQKALSEDIKRLTGGNGADVLFDPVGGDYAEPALRAMNWGGRYLVIGFAAGEIPRVPLNLTLLKGCEHRRRLLGRRRGARSEEGLRRSSRDHALDRRRQIEAACLRAHSARPRRRSHPPPHGPQGAGQSGGGAVRISCAGAVLLLALAVCAAAPAPPQARIHSIGLITALGDTCMFERVPDSPFEWIAPPDASFLEISDWGIDEHVTNAIAKSLGTHYRVQAIEIEHQDFDTWKYDSLARHIRELPIPEKPVDAYLVVLRDWQSDAIAGSDHQLGGLGLYRRDLPHGGERLGVFASWRLVLADPDSGEAIVSRAVTLPDGHVPWLSASPALWPRTQNDLTDAQRHELRSDFVKLIDETLPRALKQIGLRD